MPQDTPSRHLDKIVIRSPDGLRDRLKVAAEANGRSLNAEIVARLEASLQSGGTASPTSIEKVAGALMQRTFFGDMDKVDDKKISLLVDRLGQLLDVLEARSPKD